MFDLQNKRLVGDLGPRTDANMELKGEKRFYELGSHGNDPIAWPFAQSMTKGVGMFMLGYKCKTWHRSLLAQRDRFIFSDFSCSRAHPNKVIDYVSKLLRPQ